jgi:hypothetical protein
LTSVHPAVSAPWGSTWASTLALFSSISLLEVDISVVSVVVSVVVVVVVAVWSHTRGGAAGEQLQLRAGGEREVAPLEAGRPILNRRVLVIRIFFVFVVLLFRVPLAFQGQLLGALRLFHVVSAIAIAGAGAAAIFIVVRVRRGRLRHGHGRADRLRPSLLLLLLLFLL